MDLESMRIGTRTRLPYIPVVGKLFVRLPRTAGNTRDVACGSGWLLAALGIDPTVLARQDDPVVALMETHGVNLPFLRDVARLHDKKQIKKAFEAMKTGVAANRSLLQATFTVEAVTKVEAQIEEVLAAYAAVDTPRREF